MNYVVVVLAMLAVLLSGFALGIGYCTWDDTRKWQKSRQTHER